MFHIIFFLIVTLVQLSKTQYPQTKCSLDDAVCLTKQTQKMLKTFVDGIPELGVQTLDKFPIDPIVVNADNFFFNWSDITVGGLKDAVIDEVSINMELKTIRVVFHTNLTLEFYSIVDGVMLSVLPIQGNGRGQLSLKNMSMDILFIYDIIKNENGKDVMNMKRYYYGFAVVDGVEARIENLYDGDKKKSDQLHNLVNVNWRIMINNFGSFLNRKITSKIFDAVKVYMRSRPLNELSMNKDN